MSGYLKLNRDQRKAVKAMMDPENDTLNKVSEACNLKVATLVKYCSDKNFQEVVNNTRDMFNVNGRSKVQVS